MAQILIHAFRSRWASAACLGVVLLAVLLPPGGLGLPLCQFKRMTGLPCLGCGLTRSFIGMAHLDVGRAALFHPVGVVLFPLVLLVGTLAFFSAERREQLAGWTGQRARLVNRFGLGLLVFFLVYGFGRILWVLLTHRASPW